MKHKLLLFPCIIFSLFSFSQNGKTYAITGDDKGSFSWSDIREIDLKTGTINNVLFESKKYQSGETKIDLTTPQNYNKQNTQGTLFNTPIAASAYDSKHNRLYFAPLFTGELNYLDLSSKTTHFVITGNKLLSIPSTTEENNITRMAIGADGNGYALTNDANHLISFTTGKKIVVTDLGSLVDDPANNHISVHNKCSSWGGDIVADAQGKLYLFTASKNVFKIDVDSRIATHIGSITGISGTYSVNGAAVSDDNSVMISSANTFEGFYTVNMKDLSATKLNTSGQVFNASDLANANLLYASQLRNTVGVAELKKPEVIGNNLISIFPNPVMGSQFKVSFDNNLPGDYNIALTDLQGRLIMTKQVTVKSANQVENIQLKTKPASGVYMIKVSDGNKKNIFSDKIVVQ